MIGLRGNLFEKRVPLLPPPKAFERKGELKINLVMKMENNLSDRKTLFGPVGADSISARNVLSIIRSDMESVPTIFIIVRQ